MPGVANQTTPVAPPRREGALNGFSPSATGAIPRTPTKTTGLQTQSPSAMPGAPAPATPNGYYPAKYNNGAYRAPVTSSTAPTQTTVYGNLPTYGGYEAQVRAQYQPQIIDIQRSMAAGQLGHLTDMAGYQLSENSARANALLDQRGFDIQQQGLGLDRANNALARTDLGVDRDYLNQQRGFTTADHYLNASDINRDSDMNRVMTKSEYIGRGAQFTPMLAYKDRMREQSLANDLAGNDLSRDKSYAGLDRDMAKNNTDMQRNANSDAALDLTAQRIGVDRGKAAQMLNKTINELGLARYVSVESLMQMLSSGSAEEQAIAQQIYLEATGMHYDAMQTAAPGTPYNLPASTGAISATPKMGAGAPSHYQPPTW